MQTTQNTALSPETTPADPDRPVFQPAADIFETPSAVLIRCDMPGVAEGDLEINLENKVLTVTGTQHQAAAGNRSVLAAEYLTGTYQRSFSLNRGLDESAVSARMKNGVLEIELPKAKGAQPRKIPIQF